jgi:hypothetical protein
MAGCTKAFGQRRHGFGYASFQFVEPSTGIALKVMVVFFAGDFVAGAVAWQFHWLKPSGLHQCLNVSVNSCDPERCMTALGSLQSFFCR